MKVSCRSKSRWFPNLAKCKICPTGHFDYQTRQCDPAHVGMTVEFFINSIVIVEQDTIVDVIEDFGFAVDDTSSNTDDPKLCFLHTTYEDKWSWENRIFSPPSDNDPWEDNHVDWSTPPIFDIDET
ncbi:OLC1v1036716C1 [Oldenlandia corymbosa var. corymbosa]|uniref:OLC1v1036716C1 n=1 Tax=Oldenlandia corymbosa var. corymbosa TaxID=529605 RepID=A0AAV1CYP0_OLDCO|nr:OLC1v1036716C1 [Oldenlandia corymbosa var. corymbosa]